MSSCYIKMERFTIKNIILFKFKLFLMKQSPLVCFPALYEPVSTVVQPNFDKFGKTSTYKLAFNQNVEQIFRFLVECKKNVFCYNLSLSRFTTIKYRIVDRRFIFPRLTEFSFNLDVNVVPLAGLEKSKLSMSVWVNSFNFRKHLVLPFARSHSSAKLRPWQKTYSLFLRKISAKHFGFNSYTFAKNTLFIFGLFALRYFRLLKLSAPGVFTGCVCENSNTLAFSAFNLFNIKMQRVNAGPKTGLVVFKDPTASLLTIDEGDEESLAATWPVKHYGEFYPFSRKEIELSGASKLISDKQKGEATSFILETSRMLKRKTKIFSLFFPKTDYRIFPNVQTKLFTYLMTSLNETFFNKAQIGEQRFKLFKKNL